MAQYFHHIGASDHLRAAAGWAGAACSDLRGSHEFRMCITPWIVKRHQGELIYAGGDDVLALLPTETAIVCAEELQRAFRGIHGDGTPG